MHKRALQLLFGFILVSLTACARLLPGNIATSAYFLRQLGRLAPADPMNTLLPARNA